MLTTIQLLGLLVATVGSLFVSYWFEFPLAAGFSVGLAWLIGLVRLRRFGHKEIAVAMKEGMLQTKEVAWILVLVGLLIPAWTASGTISYLIRAGLSLIDPVWFLTSSFVLSASISMVLGTSTGTLSFIGIPLIGAASLIHIPVAEVAGAVVSGAFVGDRTSPFSSAFHLTAASTDTPPGLHGKALLPTTAAALAVSVVFFLLLDFSAAAGGGRLPTTVAADPFAGMFPDHVLLAAPAGILILAILFRVKTRYAFIASIAASVGLGSWLQGITPLQWVRYLWFGYADSALPAVQGKGLSAMVGLIILVALAGAYNGLLENSGLIRPYMQKVLGDSASLTRSTFRTALFGLGLCMTSCTQTLPIMMCGRNLLPVWTKRFAGVHLSRVVADTALVFAGLVPWNLLASLCSTIIGVPIGSYWLFAVFLWALPLLTHLLSLYGDARMAKIKIRTGAR